MLHTHLFCHDLTVSVCCTLALEYLVNRLQIVINTAARVVASRSRFSLISGNVRDILLHWLLAAQRTAFKVAALAFKALNGHAPSYLI